MDSFITKIRTNLNGVLQMTQIIDGIMMTGDDRANQIIVELHRDREPYVIPQGTKIVGYFMRSDGVTLEIEGSIIETNQVMVVVPALAYQIPGVLSIAIRMFVDPSQEQQRGYYSSETNEFILVSDPNVTEGPDGEPVVTRTTTVYANKVVIAAASCFVQITETDTIIEPGHLIPDIQDVIAKLAELDALQQQVSTAEETRVTNEQTRAVNENNREINEQSRYSAEQLRQNAETARQSNESSRNDAEQARITNETARQSAETVRSTAENTRIQNESDRRSQETTRIHNEADRVSAELARDSAETSRRNAESARASAEASRINAESARVSAESTRASSESTRVTNEQTRVSHENTRVVNENARQAAIQNMTVDAEQLSYDREPIVQISTVAGHKHIHFGLPVGRPFQIKKTFASVSAMSSYTGTDIEPFDMVMIDSNVDDPNNARLYMRSGGNNSWIYITDLSGAQGIQGPQGPQGVGIASTSLVNYQLRVTYTDGHSQTLSPPIQGPQGVGIQQVSFTSDYRVKFTMTNGSSYTSLPIRGEKGEKGDPGTGGSYLDYDSEQETLTVTFG